jgi:phosphate-selective porin
VSLRESREPRATLRAMPTIDRSSAVFAALLGMLLAAAPAPAGDWKLGPTSITNKKADFKLDLTGYAQFDLRSFNNWENADPENALRYDTADVRRVRTGLELGWKKLAVDFDLDWTGPARDLVQDGDPPFDPAEVKNAYAEYAFSKKLRLRAGTFKIPVSPEFLTSASKTDFVERSMLAINMAPDREWGAMVAGDLGRVQYQLGVFDGDGRTSDQSAGTTVAARAVVTPIKHLDVGGSFSQGNVSADPEGPDASPRGFHGRSPTGYRWYDRKYVNGRRLRWGLDAAYVRGPFAVKGEFLQGREERLGQGSTFNDLPEQVGNGWSVTTTWLVTGDKKSRTIKPKHPLFKGPGAIELSLRYESLRYDDAGENAGFEGAGARARNIRPAQDSAFWGGVSWWPTTFMRFYGDVIVERYLDALLAPEPPGTSGLGHDPLGRGNYVTLVARVQFMLP